MSVITIKFPNLPQFVAAFNRAPSIVNKHVNTAIKQTIYNISERARSVTPVDTGKLADKGNWRESFHDFYGELEPMATSPRGVKYAEYVEMGHQSYAGMPFLQSAVDSAETETKSIFEKELNNALQEIAHQVR